ncbi:hypothetical protein ACRJ4W_44545 [Streptomyces sp. GLT-R25]
MGLLNVVDPETGARREIPTHSRKLRERYAEAALEQRALIKASIRRAGAAHLRLRTDRDWVRDVVRPCRGTAAPIGRRCRVNTFAAPVSAAPIPVPAASLPPHPLEGAMSPLEVP